MFDPSRFDPPSRHAHQGLRANRWFGGRWSGWILRAVSGLALGAVLMPWFVFVRGWFGPEGLVWLGAWAVAGLLAVPAWRGARLLVTRLGWLRLGLNAGALAAVVLASQALWLAFGWLPFRPICMGSVPYEIVGRMNPEAMSGVEGWLREGWGPSAVTRNSSGQLLVRPAVRAIESDILMNFINKDGWRIAAERGIHWARNGNYVQDCEAVAAVFMEGPWELDRGWGIWPYNTIDPFGRFGHLLTNLHR